MKRAWQRARYVRVSTWGAIGAAMLLVGGVVASVPIDWRTLVSWLGHALGAWGAPGGATLTGVVLLLLIAVSRMAELRGRHRASTSPDFRAPMRPIPGWAIWLGFVLVLLIGGGAAWGLVEAFGSGSAQDKIRLEAIKLAGSIAIGTGGAAALLLAARKQRATELGVQQQEQAQLLQEQRATDARHDADERRVTELYTAAAQQLASDSAPVRMAGLYALSRLGQNNPKHRQTIVNLFCAYLRMPYSPPGDDAAMNAVTDGGDQAESAQQDGSPQPLLLDLSPTLAESIGLPLDAADQQQQELQVRLTAQRLLADHLRPDPDLDNQATNHEFWPDIKLDLSRATLYEWKFRGCSVQRGDFSRARFFGSTRFDYTEFFGEAVFDYAHFCDDTSFDHTEFHYPASFNWSHFGGSSSFSGARFALHAWLEGVKFYSHVQFTYTNFCAAAKLAKIEFHACAELGNIYSRGINFTESVIRLDRNHWDALDIPYGWVVCRIDEDGQWGKFMNKFPRKKSKIVLSE